MKKFMLFLVIVFGIILCYTNNTSKYKAPYNYLGNTIYCNAKCQEKKFNDRDWKIKYVVEPLDKKNFSKPRYFDFFGSFIKKHPKELEKADINHYQGKLYLYYIGDNPKLVNKIVKVNFSVDWNFLDPISTKGFLNKETGEILNENNEIIYNYISHVSFTPNKAPSLKFKLYITLIDGTTYDYYGVISLGPQNFLNFDYLKTRYL